MAARQYPDAKLSPKSARECLHSLRGVSEAIGAHYRAAVPHQCRRCWGVPRNVAEALVPSVHPTAYSALQAHPGLQSCILVSATLVHGYGEVDNHLKA